MKKFLKPKYLPMVTILLGALGLLCAVWFRTGEDERVLLNPLHLGAICAWILTALMIAVAVALTAPLTGKMRYDRLFPKSLPGAVGTMCCAVCLALTGWSNLTGGNDRILSLCGILGILSAAAMGYLAWCRFGGIRSNPLVRSVVVFFLLMHILCRYRAWSAEPELLRYFFDLGATVLLTLATFQRTALEAGMGSRRQYVLFTSLGAFFAMTAVPGSADRIFLTGMAIWALTDRCSLRLRKPRKIREDAQ